MTNETYVLFELAGSSYALRSSEVRHIEMLEHITPVPNTVPSVEGVVFSRGQVIPAMNLRVRFGFDRAPHTLRTRIIIAHSQERTVALIVDAARDVVSGSACRLGFHWVYWVILMASAVTSGAVLRFA